MPGPCCKSYSPAKEFPSLASPLTVLQVTLHPPEQLVSGKVRLSSCYVWKGMTEQLLCLERYD